MCVNLSICPRTWLKSRNFNSVAILLNLVKCIENRRKNIKIQAQFCRTLGEKHYNYCKTCLFVFLIIVA
jgi:hypothetical protein